MGRVRRFGSRGCSAHPVRCGMVSRSGPKSAYSGGVKRRRGGHCPGDTGLGVGNHQIRLCGALPPLSLS
jgi:hypothetical protein